MEMTYLGENWECMDMFALNFLYLGTPNGLSQNPVEFVRNIFVDIYNPQNYETTAPYLSQRDLRRRQQCCVENNQQHTITSTLG